MKKLMHYAALVVAILLLMLSYVGVGGITSAQAPVAGFGVASTTTTSVYEYLVFDLKDKLEVGPVMEVLNSYGEQGWLVVAVAVTKGAYRYVLVREKDSP